MMHTVNEKKKKKEEERHACSEKKEKNKKDDRIERNQIWSSNLNDIKKRKMEEIAAEKRRVKGGR